MARPLRVPASEVTVLVEVPRGGFVKRRPDGAVDVVSPLPSPFNYGCIEGTLAPDGDPLDVIVLGRRLRAGTRVTREVLAVYGFLDRGQLDPKLVCGHGPLRPRHRRAVERFFARYVVLKRLLQRLRGQPEPTEALGWLPWTTRG